MGAAILVVEDDPETLELVALGLEDAGYRALRAASAEQAEAALAGELPDGVVLDLVLPGQSGLALLRRMRFEARTQEVPVLLLTAHALEHDRVLGLEAGADDYIVKPFAPRDLVARIRSALRRRETTVSTVGGQVEALLMERLDATRASQAAKGDLPETELLSTRQIEILKRLVGGERVPGIARDLYLSQSTVRNHLSSIFSRLGVHSQEELLEQLRRTSTALVASR
jgi:DNA-binding response OmpR family regulator